MSVFIIAEAGSNHDGSLDQAMCLINVAAEAGADAVKFQLFRADDLYPKGTPEWESIRPLELPLEWLPALATRCESLGIEFMCSAFDEEMVDAVDLFVKRHKVAGLEITDLSLLRHIASKGKPVILSSGAATFAQIMMANLEITEECEATWLHCTTSYPAPAEEANLKVIDGCHFETTEQHWGIFAGWTMGLSDHTLDPIVAPVMAVALGATVIEKHFTLSRSLPGPDHAYALEPAELREMVRCVRLAEQMLGDGVKRIQPSEEPYRRWQHKDGGLRGG